MEAMANRPVLEFYMEEPHHIFELARSLKIPLDEEGKLLPQTAVLQDQQVALVLDEFEWLQAVQGLVRRLARDDTPQRGAHFRLWLAQAQRERRLDSAWSGPQQNQPYHLRQPLH